ncbi:transmembrane amino acid transporter protein-domain-containing protein, partial [Ochromonadaceae sp. CCMP2298]
VFNLVMAGVGVDLLTIPDIFYRTGYIGGALILLAASQFSLFSCHLLNAALHLHTSGRRINTYEDLGSACFGLTGRIVTRVVVHSTMVCICGLLMLLIGYYIAKIGGVDKVQWIIIFGGILYPLCCLRSLRQVAYLSSSGILSLCLLLVLFITASV